MAVPSIVRNVKIGCASAVRTFHHTGTSGVRGSVYADPHGLRLSAGVSTSPKKPLLQKDFNVSECSLILARRPHISREQILKAARSVFLENGLGASTASIAQRAGISEGSIFKRFATKEALFCESMASSIEELSFEHRVGRGELSDELEAIATELIAFYRDLLPKMTMLWAHGGTSPIEVFRRSGEPPPLRLLTKLSRYFEEEVQLGRLSASDPKVLARMFSASMHSFVFEEMIGVQKRMPIDQRHFTREVVRTLLHGAVPSSAPSSDRGPHD